MSIRLGLALCVLAGCTMQPARPASSAQTTTARIAALDAFANGNALCLGVEHLPPEGGQATPVALHAAADAAATATHPPAAHGPARRVIARGEGHDPHAPDRRREQEAKADVAMQFLEDLQGQDLLRLRRDFAPLNLPSRSFDEQSPGIPTRNDERNAEDEEQRLGENGHQILRRPLQRMLRRTSLVSRMELRLSDLAEMPADRGQSEEPVDDMDLGRLTMVVRPNRIGDPVEIGYRRNGILVASSQQQLKCSYTLPITESLFLDLRARQLYLDDSWQLRAELRWERSRATSVHLVFGEDLLFASDAAPYAHDPDAPTGVPGIQLYAVHRF